ncbi:MAG: sensor histidine kinase [Ilumatobacteraceae bacterium]|nr:sensor histidine kinase [Ilumatobacteraceae bacterium]
MPTLVELAAEHTSLSEDDVAHLSALISEWGMLADFSFADLLLYVPVVSPSGTNWLTASQVRAATGQTLYQSDLVGEYADDTDRPFIAAAAQSGQIQKGEITLPYLSDPVNMTAIPVMREGKAVAVLTREVSTVSGRRPGQLERTYLSIFDDFATMVATGLFPFTGRVADASVAPRVGDGVIVLDGSARVRYASPNAVSALHRIGIRANAVGQSLAELGFAHDAARASFERREPVVEELDQEHVVTLLVRSIPILKRGARAVNVIGGVVLMRDVSELRRRDRLILTKDATIKEIHHRVKNNLQTISSLLRLQGRRLASDEAKAAVADSVRRIRTIALVHETLSREPGEDVAFIEIVRPLIQLTQESLQSSDRPIRFEVRGDAGRLPATIATPLSVVILELLQNVVDHAFGDVRRDGVVRVFLQRDKQDDALHIRVIDNGVGVDDQFNIAQATGLGLSIVRTLVTTELGGTIAMRPATQQELDDAAFNEGDEQIGTVVDLRIPTESAH